MDSAMTIERLDELNGQPVLADGKTMYVLHGQALATDLEVRVTGYFDANGVLIAHKIQAYSPNTAKRGPRAARSPGRAGA